MMLPLQDLSTYNYEFGLIVAVAIGFGFGFVLERAGFGRATKLAAQFYGTDMTVFKVMFGAIVTAMIGLVIASGLGLVDLKLLSESAASPTYLWPMLVGGLLLGAGFIISGYCPGTSMVAAASGNLDGVVTFAGVIVGSLLYGEVQPLVASFHNSGDVGHLFLYDWLGVEPVVMAAAIVAMAIAGFVVAEKLEKIFSAKFRGQPAEPSPRRPRRLVFATLGSLTVAGLATLLLPVRLPAEPSATQAAEVAQADFARRLIDSPWSMRILDLRPREACAEKRIPGAECVPADDLDKLGLAFAPPSQDLVLVAEQDLAAIPAAARTYRGKLLVLADGWAGWQRYALSDPQPPSAQAGPEEREAYRFQAALNQAMTGAAPPPPPPAAIQTFTAPKKRKGGGCS